MFVSVVSRSSRLIKTILISAFLISTTLIKNSSSSSNSSTIPPKKEGFKRGSIKCESSLECQSLDPNSLCLMTLIIPNEKRCECAPGFIYHPLTKSCVQLFECRIDSDCKFKNSINRQSPNSIIIGSNPIIDEFECINKSCRKKKIMKRFNELKTWLPLIIPSSILAVGAVLFLICANRRRGSWFNQGSISSSLKSSRAPSPPPPFEYPPSYSSCFHSCSNLHSITTYHSVSSNHRITAAHLIYQPSPSSIRSTLSPPPQYTSRAPSRENVTIPRGRMQSRDASRAPSLEVSRAPSPTPSLTTSIAIEPSSSYGSVKKDITL